MSDATAKASGDAPAGLPDTAYGRALSLLGQSLKVKQHELHCHPDVWLALRMAAPPAEPQPPFTGEVGFLTGIPVIEKPELGSGCWELYENGEMIKSGQLGGEG